MRMERIDLGGVGRAKRSENKERARDGGRETLKRVNPDRAREVG